MQIVRKISNKSINFLKVYIKRFITKGKFQYFLHRRILMIWFTTSSMLVFEESKENTEESTRQVNRGIITSRYIIIYLLLFYTNAIIKTL